MGELSGSFGTGVSIPSRITRFKSRHFIRKQDKAQMDTTWSTQVEAQMDTTLLDTGWSTEDTLDYGFEVVTKTTCTTPSTMLRGDSQELQLYFQNHLNLKATKE